jgi:hypothetical protein
MKIKIKVLAIFITIIATNVGSSQGFINLNFEQANVNGYAVGSSSVPATSAFPGWQVYYGSAAQSQVWYDATSLGGNIVSIWDTNSPGTDALQGQYSAALFSSLNLSSSISQTGTVPVGSESLTMDIFAANPGTVVVTLGGQTLTLTPLSEVDSSEYPYTVYGANIASFAGLTSQQLVFTCLAGTQAGDEENEIIVDDIRFSASPVPEPRILALCALGGLSFVWRRLKRPYA